MSIDGNRKTVQPSMSNGQYEVLNPWAEVDPISFRGLTAPRLADLAGTRGAAPPQKKTFSVQSPETRHK
jgi:hypothetical protein